MEKIKIDNLIFDVDGTLVNSIQDIVKSVKFTLENLGLDVKDSKEIISYIGKGVEYLIEQSIGKDNKKLFDKALNIFTEHHLKHCSEESNLYPNVREILEYFSYKNKYILTNRKKVSADKVLKAFNIDIYFKKVLGADDANCMKPSVCPIEKLNLNKDTTMIIGDMDIDIKTGKDAGIKTCWVSYGLGKHDEIALLIPDYIINELGELKNIIY